MARVQLALNVSDLDTAVAFYSKLFAAEPAKRRPGYANFAIAEPPLKLVLIEATGGGTLNHLGVEVSSAEEVAASTRRLAGEGLETITGEGVDCCYAKQDKVWVSDPDGAPWEVYTVLADSEGTPGTSPRADESCGAGACASAEETGTAACRCSDRRLPSSSAPPSGWPVSGSRHAATDRWPRQRR